MPLRQVAQPHCKGVSSVYLKGHWKAEGGGDDAAHLLLCGGTVIRNRPLYLCGSIFEYFDALAGSTNQDCRLGLPDGQ